MSTLKVTNIQDTSGGNSSTTAEIKNGIAKAWVNFNGTGTVAIRASFNVSSITDNGVGDYTVNFATALADANYAVFGSGVCASDQGGSTTFQLRIPPGFGSNATLKSTTQVRMLSRREQNFDIAEANVTIFR
jgi:hypothetical protein